MTNTLPTISDSDLGAVTGGDSPRAALMRKTLQAAYGSISMVGRTKFTAPPFNEGLSHATGQFTPKGTGIPTLNSFGAWVDTARKQVYGLAVKTIAQ
jgi:hypothetical protein